MEAGRYLRSQYLSLNIEGTFEESTGDEGIHQGDKAVRMILWSHRPSATLLKPANRTPQLVTSKVGLAKSEPIALRV